MAQLSPRNVKVSKDDLLFKKLENVGLSESYTVLKKEGVTESSLWTLSQDDLEKIGVTLMQRRKYRQEFDKIIKNGNLRIFMS